MNQKLKFKEIKVQAMKEANSPFIYLLDKKPIYIDSVFKIYITKIEDNIKLVYIAEGDISDKQKNSKFFLHIYPEDKILLEKTKHKNLSFDFKKKPLKIIFQNKDYYIFEIDLPTIGIEKINTGQYGYKGDNSVSWKINSILKINSIKKVFEFNNDRISLEDKIE